MAKKVKSGDTVNVHYTGRLKDGDVFDSSHNRKPLQFEVGAGNVIKGVEKAVVGMQPGEKKKVTVSPEDGYGNYNKKFLFEMPKERIPEDIKPQKGLQLQMVNNQGQKFTVVVADIKEKSITLDANHPLAGKELVFDLELVGIT